jgi:hypothetical protein
MPRNQSRAGRRARLVQKTTGAKGKYTELLREETRPRSVRREPVHAEPVRRLAAHLRADLGADGEKAARLVDEALTWALKDSGLKQALHRMPVNSAARARRVAALDEHTAGEVTVHDAPLVQVVYEVLEMAAVVAAAALRTLREAARIPDEDELTDADCMFTLEEAARFAHTAADLAVHPAA